MAGCGAAALPKHEETAANTPPNISETETKIAAIDETPEISELALEKYFNEFSGSAVFMDSSKNMDVYNLPATLNAVSPCSTFKIVSTLAAFESQIINPTDSMRSWNGVEWPIESWNQDLTVQEAFKSSCVWYYRKIIDQIGIDYMQAFLDTLNYGNCDIKQWEGSGFNGNPQIDGFWLESTLLVTPQEQVAVMHTIFENELSFDDTNISSLKEMMYVKTLENGVRLYGKTGSGSGGWYVGFYETSDETVYFAVHLNEHENANGQKAQEITESIIEDFSC